MPTKKVGCTLVTSHLKQFLEDYPSSSEKQVFLDICHATRMDEGPKVTLDIQCLQQGGSVALTSTNNYFLHQRGGGGGTRAITV